MANVDYTNGAYVWGQWNQAYYITNSTATATINPWDWNAYGSTNITVTNSIWYNWTDDQWAQEHPHTKVFPAAQQPYVDAINNRFNNVVVETEEQKRIRLEVQRFQRETYEREVLEHQKRVEEIQKRAESLLMSVLSAEEREQLKQYGTVEFTVEGGDQPPRRYRVHRGSHGNIYRLGEDGAPVERLCVQPGGVPTDDMVAAQIVHLKYDEAHIRQRANITPLRVA